ncbi:hypothetical protein ACFSTC_27490 [Nonomuraea ferruginea]
MYISGGENVYPAEVEGVLFGHPAVAEAAVVGGARREMGRGRPGLRRPPRDGVALTAAELADFLRSRLAKYKIPVYFDIMDTLPRTGSGKILKPELRTRLLPPGAAPPRSPSSASPPTVRSTDDQRRLSARGQRAARELRATGEHPRRRTAQPTDSLTAHEPHIARLVATAATSREVVAPTVPQPTHG